TDITLTVEDANTCSETLAITAPDCNCPVVDAPMISVNTVEYCSGETIPTLSVTVGLGETADWYDAPIGGNLLVDNETSYTPTVAGTYYVEAQNTTTLCTSSTRIPVVLTENALPIAPMYSANGTICSTNSGSVSVTNPIGTSIYSLVGVAPVLASQTGTSFSDLAPGTYELTETNVFGCTSPAVTIVIESNCTTATPDINNTFVNTAVKGNVLTNDEDLEGDI
uniref:immunoglobulin domain-containing protein n=1 Tax=Algibacter pacificus TaxID=2599389 RepID=UPI001C9CCA69